MGLNQREKWLFILTVIKTSRTGKAMPLEMQQAVCEFLRKKLCPEIDYPEWLQMEKDINKEKQEMNDLMFEAMKASAGVSDLPPEAKKMFSELDIKEVDDKVRGEVSKIDFGKLKEALDSLPNEQKKELEPMFENIENLAGEYGQRKKKNENKS